jgi:crotonobetainyl-CoA:carnitine CoA-transferase CaiB-like acyl-CoA transferase
MDAVLKTQPTQHWAAAFAREGALGAPIYDYGDWLSDPHVQAVDAVPNYGLPDGTTVRVPHLPGGVMDDAAVPVIGEHSRAVLGELGYSRQEVDDLVARNVVVDLGAQ